MNHDHNLRFTRPTITLLCLFCFFLMACGKKGDPSTPNAAQNFELVAVSGTIVNGCLAITGQFQGAYRYLERVRLELDTLTGGPEDCAGCPFVPTEVVFFDANNDISLNKEDGSFGFSFCPQPSQGYRWRLAGMNHATREPHTISGEQFTMQQ